MIQIGFREFNTFLSRDFNTFIALLIGDKAQNQKRYKRHQGAGNHKFFPEFKIF